jgi:rhombotail lipoprotein
MRKLAPAAVIMLLTAYLLGGCTYLWQSLTGTDQRKGASSSLVNYLYPKGEIPPKYDETVPSLNLPLRVGLAFVPAYQQSQGLSEVHKNELLENVKAAFQGRDYIQEITIIPETYLGLKGGFDAIDQVSRLYGLDVIALVSYDQMAYSDDTTASILYWTIVGAYVIKGSKNDVQTFVDTAIFDVRTHKLLFRAPGTDRIESTSTLVKSGENIRKSQETGFNNAVSDMIVNLDKELDAFKERIKQDKTVSITHREGYSGGGALGPLGIAVLLAGLFARRALTRRA